MVLLALVVLVVVGGLYLGFRITGRRPRVHPGVVAGVLVAVVVAAVLLQRTRDDGPEGDYSVAFGSSDGDPGCVYDPGSSSVEATVTVKGSGPARFQVTATVTTYADENTTDALGSASGTVAVEGGSHASVVLTLTIPVDRPPHVDEDGVAARRISVKD